LVYDVKTMTENKTVILNFYNTNFSI